MKKVVTVVGARPQFIKAAAVSRQIALSGGLIEEVMLHTGQHYDPNMSQVFFDELEIPAPSYNLEIGGGLHGASTGRMLESIEKVLLAERPDSVLIYGDTNSTLAGALAAAKLHIPVAHVEAGLRSFNLRMPEEINRVLADRVSTQLFCPTEAAVRHLAAEGTVRGVHLVGDVMYDVALHYGQRARAECQVLHGLGLAERSYALATCHRAENTDDPHRLQSIFSALALLAERLPVVVPLHPRTRKQLQHHGIDGLLGALRVVDPQPFLAMVALEQSAQIILTDSGGVQKEAFFYEVPCVTLRDETEWTETVELGWNRLAGASTRRILEACELMFRSRPAVVGLAPYGDGCASQKIVELLVCAP